MADYADAFMGAMVNGLNPMNRIVADYARTENKSKIMTFEHDKLDVNQIYEDKIEAALSKITELLADSKDNTRVIDHLENSIKRWTKAINRVENL